MTQCHYYLVAVQKPREIAVRVLQLREEKRYFVEDLLETELSTAKISGVDRGLCHELVYGIVRWQRTLDWLIDRKTGGRPQKSTLQILLRLGLYQIFWLDRIPDHAAVHETVEMGKRLGFGPQAGFLNAVLRSYLRAREETAKLLLDLKSNQAAIGYSHPDWLVERWRKNLGDAGVNRLMEWNNAPPKVFARRNSLKTEAEPLLARWRAEGVEAVPVDCDWVSAGTVFEIRKSPPFKELPSFRAGDFYLQDPSTLLAVAMLDPQPGEVILDLCAAPGGKAGFIGQRMANQGRLVAHDAFADRLELLRENAARLGITTMTVTSDLDKEAAGSFDRILIDAPCSNTGVMRRRVDLRWRIQPTDLEALKRTQGGILTVAAPLLKPGGLLVYSTCSLEPEENRGATELFLGERADFELREERALIPIHEAVDGAYVAVLRKRG